MKSFAAAGFAAGLLIFAGMARADDSAARADAIHRSILVLDSHLDIPLDYGQGNHDPGVDGDTQVRPASSP